MKNEQLACDIFDLASLFIVLKDKGDLGYKDQTSPLLTLCFVKYYSSGVHYWPVAKSGAVGVEVMSTRQH